MKKIIIMLMTAIILTACGNAENEVTIADTTSTASEVITTTTEATTTTVATTTERAKSKDELAEECWDIVFNDLNRARRNIGVEEVKGKYDLNMGAKQLVQEFIDDVSVYNNGARADGSHYGTVLEDYSLEFRTCYVLYGQTNSYDTRSITKYVSNGCGVWNDAAWDSFGFYYDQEHYYWVAFLCDMTPGIAGYNSTPYETLITYMDTLINDDYEAYLEITCQEDTAEIRENFDYFKEGYVGININNILYYETKLNEWYGSSDVDYKVVEFTDDGDYKFDINTYDNAYGTVRINELPSGGYYVWGHVRYTPFFIIN